KRVPYVHTTFGPFINALKLFLLTRVYNFNFAMVGTMDKAIQLIFQSKSDSNMLLQGPLMPMIVFTPSIIEQVREADFPFKYTTYHPFQSKWFQQPFIFQDGSALDIVTRRMLGNVDIRVFAHSLMEIHDIQMAFLDAFRGYNKWIMLTHLKQFLVIEDDVRLFTDEGVKFLDWSKTNLSNMLIKSINKNKYYLQTDTDVQVRLDGLTDASEFYGGAGLSDYGLTGTLTYEIELPALYNLYTDLDIVDFDVNIYNIFAANYDPNMKIDPNSVFKLIGISKEERNDKVAYMYTDEEKTLSLAEILRRTVFEIIPPLPEVLILENADMDLTKDFIVLVNGDLFEDIEVINDHALKVNYTKPNTEKVIFEVMEINRYGHFQQFGG
ncbi:MAG TPA: hypothetical protein PLP73_03935, partial [Candidatus Absconditabacterales bacterium]|nr:hypothetical protein [Candidatus Absconditabacterales bacterium]